MGFVHAAWPGRRRAMTAAPSSASNPPVRVAGDEDGDTTAIVLGGSTFAGSVRLALSTVRTWMAGQATLPTTRAGTEMCIVLALIGLRLTASVQLSASLPGSLSRSPEPELDLALACVWLIETGLLLYAAARHNALRGSLWPVIDTSTACVILALQPLISRPADRIGTWVAWGFAIGVGVAFTVGVAAVSRWLAIGSAAVLAATYLAVSLPDATAAASSTVLANSLGFFGFALFPRAIAGYLRRVGDAADESRNKAAEAARKAELLRHQRFLHDHATVLGWLAEPPIDPDLAQLYRDQAARASNLVKHFLSDDGSVRDADDSDRSVPDIARHAASQFRDLPLEVNVDLARGVVIEPETGTALRQALETVLHNVRNYSHAAHIVIHADAFADGSWELTVQDDGIGFDPHTTPPGFGLRVVLMEGLAKHGIDAVVRSAPGDGTVVEIRAPRQP
jgi:signal transduction histidine kinase